MRNTHEETQSAHQARMNRINSIDPVATNVSPELAARSAAALSELATVLTGPPGLLGRMLEAARQYLRTPAGSWANTQQAWSQFTDTTWVVGDHVSSAERTRIVLEVASKHFAADRHPSRK
jgi:hypothetical protein